MSTGGFRDISTLSSGRRPRSMTMSDHDEEDMRDVEMGAGTSLLDEDGHYFDDDTAAKKLEKQHSRSPSPSNSVRSMSGVTPLSIPKDKKPPRKLKSILKSLKDDRTVLLSRPRVVFRMFSLVASGAVLGASGHILFHYLDTRNIIASTGEPIWGETIELKPTNILLAASIYVFVFDLVLSIYSFWPKGRYLKNKIIAALALLHSTISLVAGIVALGFSEEKRNPNSMFRVCQMGDQEPADRLIMDFDIHCSEQRATWVAACIYTVAHGLIIPTILLGFVSCNGARKRPTFKDAIIIRDNSADDGIFQKLKQRFSRRK